jgi:putative ABC transport system ATP-binding protein
MDISAAATSQTLASQGSSDSPEAVVELSGVRFSWSGVPPFVIDIGRLQVARGERIFLRGPSGSGKSTLLSLLAGVITPMEGTVRVLGQNIGALGGAARDRFRADHIGFIFQMFNLIPYLSVVENVCLPCGAPNVKAGPFRPRQCGCSSTSTWGTQPCCAAR